MTVVYWRFNSACSSSARCCSTFACADCTLASVTLTCCGPVIARLNLRIGGLHARPRLFDSLLRGGDVLLRFVDLRLLRIERGAHGCRSRDRLIELLLRNLVFIDKLLVARDILLRLWRIRFGDANIGLRGRKTRARRASCCSAPLTAALASRRADFALFNALEVVVEVIGTSVRVLCSTAIESARSALALSRPRHRNPWDPGAAARRRL